jgi:hypothetical protein
MEEARVDQRRAVRRGSHVHALSHGLQGEQGIQIPFAADRRRGLSDRAPEHIAERPYSRYLAHLRLPSLLPNDIALR